MSDRAHAIYIISPHLDDAALSCAEHILAWKRNGRSVHVLTLFTEFGEWQGWFRPFVPAGCNSTSYGAMRRAEDIEAMQALGVEFRHAGFTDAAFRQSDGKYTYHDISQLLAGKLAESDASMSAQISVIYHSIPAESSLVLPLGIGNHVDHILARSSGNGVDPRRVSFYCDLPYARNPLRWSRAVFAFFRGRKLSVRAPSRWKVNLLRHYKSQFPFLFRGRLRFPEVLLLSEGIAP